MKYPKIGNFRYKKIRKDYLITNDSGNWLFLTARDFKRLLEGRMKKNEAPYFKLKENGFIDLDKQRLAKLAGSYLRLNRSFLRGPGLFIMVLTLRCNHACVYCHAVPEGLKAKETDMREAIAKKTVDLIFNAPSRLIRIEFQGGEPLLNWPVLKYVVKYAKALNKIKNKDLRLSLVSNLTLLDGKKLKFLLDEGVSVCCSFDGQAEVHDKNRIYLSGKSSYQAVASRIKAIKKIIARKKEKNASFSGELDAILTISRFSLPFHREIVNEYIKMGFFSIFIRPLGHFGLKTRNAEIIGYKAEEFIDFYKKTMDYILELNLKGRFFIERGSYYALKKILRNEDPAYLDMRSPCGAGIGQLAFDYDGGIFTCDEGRMARRLGYDDFQVGTVGEENFNQLIDNNVVKTTCLASCLDNQVACSNCAYKPYCGTCPVANFVEHGTIFPQISNTDRCKVNKAMFDYLFSKIRNKKYRKIFESWLEEFPGL